MGASFLKRLTIFALLLRLYCIVLTYSQVVKKDLMDMLVRELKEELEARSESKTGNKAWLRRRLHGAIVRAHLLDAAGV